MMCHVLQGSTWSMWGHRQRWSQAGERFLRSEVWGVMEFAGRLQDMGCLMASWIEFAQSWRTMLPYLEVPKQSQYVSVPSSTCTIAHQSSASKAFHPEAWPKKQQQRLTAGQQEVISFRGCLSELFFCKILFIPGCGWCESRVLDPMISMQKWCGSDPRMLYWHCALLLVHCRSLSMQTISARKPVQFLVHCKSVLSFSGLTSRCTEFDNKLQKKNAESR